MNPAAPENNIARDSALLDSWASVVTHTLRAIRVLGDELESEIGLPMAEAEVLLRIYRSPERRLATTALAKELLFTSGGFTKLADRLVASGLLAREPCQTDRRVTYLTLTKDGRALARKALRAHAAGIRRHVLDAVGPDALNQWRAAAGQVGSQLDQAAPASYPRQAPTSEP